MSQRLVELQRQRALLQEHLAWLDREIAAESSGRAAETAQPATDLPPAPNLPLHSIPQAGPIATFAGRPISGTPAAPSSATPANVVAPLPLPATSASAGGTPDAILDQYRVAPDALRSDVRKGCFLYFALALVLLGIGVVALYVLFRL